VVSQKKKGGRVFKKRRNGWKGVLAYLRRKACAWDYLEGRKDAKLWVMCQEVLSGATAEGLFKHVGGRLTKLGTCPRKRIQATQSNIPRCVPKVNQSQRDLSHRKNGGPVRSEALAGKNLGRGRPQSSVGEKDLRVSPRK